MQEAEAARGPPPYAGAVHAPAEDPMKESILLAACAANEMLPQNPDLPADVFTACLTTPIKVRHSSLVTAELSSAVQPTVRRE